MAWVTGQQLRLYNSLGRRIEDFTPSADVVGLYSCGPTVYSFPHLGNMRPYVFADTLRRALRWKGIPVRARRQHHRRGPRGRRLRHRRGQARGRRGAGNAGRSRRSPSSTRRRSSTTMAALNVQPADVYPRASDYVEQMIAFAVRLEAARLHLRAAVRPVLRHVQVAAATAPWPCLTSPASARPAASSTWRAASTTATSPSGGRRSRASAASCAGTRRGAGARRAGTWNAR